MVMPPVPTSTLFLESAHPFRKPGRACLPARDDPFPCSFAFNPCRRCVMKGVLPLCALLLCCAAARADEAFVKEALGRPILPSGHTLKETQDHLEPKLPKLPAFENADEWDRYADKIRQEMMDRVILRG